MVPEAPSTSTSMVSFAASWSFEMAESESAPVSAEISNFTAEFAWATTATRLSAAERASASIFTVVAQEAGSSAL